jgi:poly(3-hydroxybutyrate) depolymerase
MKPATKILCRSVLLASASTLLVGCIASSPPKPNVERRAAATSVGNERVTEDTGNDTVCHPARAIGENGIIDDFERDQGRIMSNESRDGFWFSYDDGTGGKLVREELTSDTRVLHVTASGFSNWGAGVGATLLSSTTMTRSCAYDASAHSGIRFRARGKGRTRVLFATISNTPPEEGGQCTRARNCYDRPGAWLDLKDQWQIVELPFNSLLPEGWGGDASGLNASELVSIQFRIPALIPFEMWLDDLSFFSLGREAAASNTANAHKCPLDAVPVGAKIDPTSSVSKLKEGLSLRTFEQATKSCGTVTRRYLSYVPKRLEPRTSAPILIALHGSECSAEIMQYSTKGRFEELATRDGFIVVYGNAAPGAASDPASNFPNTGAWRQDFYDDGEVDDVAYILSVIDDLKARGVTNGKNAVYLVGLSNGGGMVLKAAKRAPDRFRGIAPFMAFDGVKPTPVPELHGKMLTRVLFAYTPNDPGLPSGYHEILQTLPAQWARALGLAQTVIENPKRTELPNGVREGDGYDGPSKAAQATLNSSAVQYDMCDANAATCLRTVVLDHSGHDWPNPAAETIGSIISRLGFHNQDFDAADLAWEFLSGGTQKPGPDQRGKSGAKR